MIFIQNCPLGGLLGRTGELSDRLDRVSVNSCYAAPSFLRPARLILGQAPSLVYAKLKNLNQNDYHR
jgi:hypothetical protein